MFVTMATKIYANVGIFSDVLLLPSNTYRSLFLHLRDPGEDVILQTCDLFSWRDKYTTIAF